MRLWVGGAAVGVAWLGEWVRMFVGVFREVAGGDKRCSMYVCAWIWVSMF